jgi:cell division protein FtsL
MDDINRPLAPQQTPQTEPEQLTPTPEVHEPVVGHVHHGSKKKAVVRILLTLILAALAAGAVYFWQQGKNSDLQSQLNTKNSENSALQKQVADNTKDSSKTATQEPDQAVSSSTPASGVSEDLIPGDVETDRTDGRILIGTIYKYSLDPSAVWVEYGTDPKKLDTTSTKITSELGLGNPDEIYASGRSVSVTTKSLKSGTAYYYRTAATVKGKTLYSSVASFTTKK